jgi:hypothetical protein
MRKFFFALAVGLSALALFGPAAQADDEDDGYKDYFKRLKKQQKKQDDFYREQQKRAEEYYREQAKRQAEYYREQQKWEREFRKGKGKYQPFGPWDNQPGPSYTPPFGQGAFYPEPFFPDQGFASPGLGQGRPARYYPQGFGQPWPTPGHHHRGPERDDD